MAAHPPRLRLILLLAAFILPPSLAPSRTQAETPNVEPMLIQGELKPAAKLLNEHLAGNADDQQARYNLAVVQLLQGFERLAQSLHHHGLQPRGRNLGVLNLPLPIPPNPEPEPISYEQLRAIIQQFIDDLTVTRETLARIDDPEVKLPLRVGMLRLDFNGDGFTEESEAFWRLFARMTGATQLNEDIAKAFAIHFDLGDVYWLRGYCRMLSATCEIMLAHDFREILEVAGHLLFARVKSPHKFIDRSAPLFQFGDTDIIDIIAFIHLTRFEVKEPKRLRAALAHMEEVVELSRVSWQIIMTEADNDNEWIPNAQQTSMLAGMRLTPQMIDGWLDMLDEWEAILKGDLLIPFWRTGDDRGVNFRKMFTNPRTFDLVIWIQGAGATPYLQQGAKVDPEKWRELNRTLGGNFFGFAFWFN